MDFSADLWSTMPKDKPYEPPNEKRQHRILQKEELAEGKTTRWSELAISGNFGFFHSNLFYFQRYGSSFMRVFWLLCLFRVIPLSGQHIYVFSCHYDQDCSCAFDFILPIWVYLNPFLTLALIWCLKKWGLCLTQSILLWSWSGSVLICRFWRNKSSWTFYLLS